MNAHRQGGNGTAAKKKQGNRSADNSLRVIAGRWRGRKFNFPDGHALRPSPDRVRETLFNWLRADIAGAHCLDAFSGSGALSLESLSRGAVSVCSWDNHNPAIQSLRQHYQVLAEQFDSDQQWHIARKDSLAALKQRRPEQLPAFDIVFLDPPFRQGWLPQVCTMLEQNDWLTTTAKIYIEQERDHPVWDLPNTWHALKQTHAGQVACLLAARNPNNI